MRARAPAGSGSPNVSTLGRCPAGPGPGDGGSGPAARAGAGPAGPAELAGGLVVGLALAAAEADRQAVLLGQALDLFLDHGTDFAPPGLVGGVALPPVGDVGQRDAPAAPVPCGPGHPP